MHPECNIYIFAFDVDKYQENYCNSCPQEKTHEIRECTAHCAASPYNKVYMGQSLQMLEYAVNTKIHDMNLQQRNRPLAFARTTMTSEARLHQRPTDLMVRSPARVLLFIHKFISCTLGH
mgnify:CR=1 FL=1